MEEARLKKGSLVGRSCFLMLNQSPLKSFWSQLNVVGGEDCRKETGVFLLDQIWGEGSFLAPWGGGRLL